MLVIRVHSDRVDRCKAFVHREVQNADDGTTFDRYQLSSCGG